MHKIGAHYLGNSSGLFRVWAPFAKQVNLEVQTPEAKIIKLNPEENGYWSQTISNITPGNYYYFQLDGQRFPDPASFFQPEGVHNPSAVFDHNAFKWQDRDWQNPALKDYIIYELHIGTFNKTGTFAAAIERLADLKDLGINAIEIMPVAQFPGDRNWGYDGVHPFAVQNSYGGPEEFKKFINAAHQHKIAVILDVVYNHLGPEGNYLGQFGPYFTDKYKTPWGCAINFDDQESDQVRHFFIQNALYWFEHFHLDALRIDAIHGIYDFSAKPFLQELAEKTAEFSQENNRPYYLIVESDLNDARVIRPASQGGYGLSAQWNDDYHHCLHTLLTKEKTGYYVDFGKTHQLSKALNQGFVYTWDYSKYRKRRHGNASADLAANQFVVFSQNHDQVGNRLLGNRLSTEISFEGCKLAAAAVLLSPYIPLIFMGEEYAENTPFNYFISHLDKNLVEAVRQGRQKEFASFNWKDELKDPQSTQTFEQSKINWEKRNSKHHQTMLKFYQHLIILRRSILPFSQITDSHHSSSFVEEQNVVFLHKQYQTEQVICVMNFSEQNQNIELKLENGHWQKILDSADIIWEGPGSQCPTKLNKSSFINISGLSFVVYKLES
ncbi:MAG: malto-oligosyltrehalose trehalohydrolase [Pseudomonadota bacterium]